MEIRHLTSPANPHFRNALRLREGRDRRKSGRSLVDGVRETARALAAGIPIEELFISEREDPAECLDRLAKEADLALAPLKIMQVSAEMLDQLAFGNRNEGLVGVFRIPDRSLEQLQVSAQPLVVVLDQLEKPGNIGAVFRSADAAGADAVILSNPVGDLFNPNTIRASAGTVFSMPCAVSDCAAIVPWLRSRDIRIIVTHLSASLAHWDCQWQGGAAIVLGNEAKGLGADWLHTQATAIKIPMAGIADSLNASVTAAICLYEAVRQRRQ